MVSTTEQARIWTQGTRMDNKTLAFGLFVVISFTAISIYAICYGVTILMGNGDVWGLGYISAGLLIVGIFAWSFITNIKKK